MSDPIGEALDAVQAEYVAVDDRRTEVAHKRAEIVRKARAARWTRYRIARRLGVHENTVAAIEKTIAKREKEQP